MTGPDQRRPHALVVVESMFGNTEQVARAVAAGLGDGGVDASSSTWPRRRSTCPPTWTSSSSGCPTHAFSLSRPAHPGGRRAPGRPTRARGHRAARVAGRRASPGRPAQPGHRGLRHARLEGTTAARGRRTPRGPPGPAPGTDRARSPRGVPGRGHSAVRWSPASSHERGVGPQLAGASPGPGRATSPDPGSARGHAPRDAGALAEDRLHHERAAPALGPLAHVAQPGLGDRLVEAAAVVGDPAARPRCRR